jgi:hypothetical protein
MSDKFAELRADYLEKDKELELATKLKNEAYDRWLAALDALHTAMKSEAADQIGREFHSKIGDVKIARFTIGDHFTLHPCVKRRIKTGAWSQGDDLILFDIAFDFESREWRPTSAIAPDERTQHHTQGRTLAPENKLKKYAVLGGGDTVLTVIETASLSQAVDIKNWFQDVMNKQHNTDEIFSVREATPADIAEGERIANEANKFIAIPDHLLRRR